MIFKNIKKEKIIKQYINLLEASCNDEEIFKKVEGMINYHKDFELDPDLIKQNGHLRTIYRYYVLDKRKMMEYLKKAPLTEIEIIQERIMADEMLLNELSSLITAEENAKYREEKRKALEKNLSSEEIKILQSKYLNNSEINFKR